MHSNDPQNLAAMFTIGQRVKVANHPSVSIDFHGATGVITGFSDGEIWKRRYGREIINGVEYGSSDPRPTGETTISVVVDFDRPEQLPTKFLALDPAAVVAI